MRRAGSAVGDVVRDTGAEDECVLRHKREFRAQGLGVQFGNVDPIERDDAGSGIVETLDQLKQRRLARARRADDGYDFARRDAEADVVKNEFLSARGIGEADAPEFDLAPDGSDKRQRFRRRDDARARGQQFPDSRGGAGGLTHLAPHFGQLTERTGAQHRVEHELHQRSAAHPSVDHVARAEPKNNDDAGKGEEQRCGRDESARFRHVARGLVGAVGGGAIARGREGLGDEGLHDAHRAETFGGEGGRIGERVLSAARARAHGSSRRVERQDDDGYGDQHIGRELRAGGDHHRDRADEHEDVA